MKINPHLKPDFSSIYGAPYYFDVMFSAPTFYSIYNAQTYDVVDIKLSLDAAQHEARRLTWLKIVKEKVTGIVQQEKAQTATILLPEEG